MIFLHTKWSDVDIVSYGSECFLIQGRKNKITRSSSFRIVLFRSSFNCYRVGHLNKQALINANMWEVNKE